MRTRLVVAVAVAGASLALCAGQPNEAPGKPKLEEWRVKLFKEWHALPEPPITPYSGPFQGEARGFKGEIDRKTTDPKEVRALAALYDWNRLGLYDPDKDPRPIDDELEKAALEDWRRMGYNCAYKGNAFTYRVGRFLKKNGLLGAIDQTLWGGNGPPPVLYDGTLGRRHAEACGSFFLRQNYELGVSTLTHYATNYGEPDMFKVGNVYLTCSWDEVGLRTRQQIDYRPEAIAEYASFLRDVCFQDKGPGEDSNGDGRTYNAFTGENLKYWWEVRPPVLSDQYHTRPKPVDEKYTRPGAYKLWLDFHRYFTFEFFRRTSEDASQRLSQENYAREFKRRFAADEPFDARKLRTETERRVECYPFPIAFFIWPGMDAFMGLSAYWNHRLNPVINVEQCWPDHPAMAVNYAITDHLSRKYQNLVMGWSWFFPRQHGPGHLYDGEGEIERALARMMAHRVDGIHHWLYADEYRGPDEAPLRQRRQLAYWHNFLRSHYRTFLSRSEPLQPEVAILLPDYTGYFYPKYNYPKFDYAWAAVGLQAAQIPFAIVTEEEIESDPAALKDFKLVYVLGSEWTTPALQARFSDFLAQGGVLCANVDSLSLDITTGKRTDYLEKTFGVKLVHRHENPFYPAVQTQEDWDWADKLTNKALPRFQSNNVHEGESALWKKDGEKWVRDEEAWQKLEAVLAQMPKTGRGELPQSCIDMRNPPKIKYGEGIGPAEPVVDYGTIVTGEAVRGKPCAWYGEQVCGVETEGTVWLGVRPGASLHAIFPRMPLSQGCEPTNPFVTNVSNDYGKFQPYVDVLSYPARKAGVHRRVTVTREGRMPCELEVLPRADAAGTLMVFVINHGQTALTCQVEVDAELMKKPGLKGAEAWDMLREKTIEENTDGRFDLEIPASRVAVFMLGSAKTLAPVKEAQQALNAMDFSVPKYFSDRAAKPTKQAP